jgi:outer membrane receptor for ferrienterochelin and colicin
MARVRYRLATNLFEKLFSFIFLLEAFMTTRGFFLFFIYMISIVSNGVSETIPDDKLLRILITPNRFQTKLNQTASNIIVIDKTDIENSNSNSLSEILNSQPGINSGNQGGVGQTS